jgi:hypothetical protein
MRDQRRLANPCLPAHQCEPPARALRDPGQSVVERRELLTTLDEAQGLRCVGLLHELHRPIIFGSQPGCKQWPIVVHYAS